MSLTSPTPASLDDQTLLDLSLNVQGELIRPEDAGYNAARKVWNGMVDRTPGLIVRVSGPADVVAAVNASRAKGAGLAVRGGGHSVAGLAMCDGGVVLDLSRMKGIHVDPERRTVRAQGGVTWGELDRETQLFGLATTGGAISTTGIAGLTLGGGVGWLMRRHGLACDNLLSVEIVTADGRVLTASETENPDLFWGVRGGGGNFGVVTSFEFRLHKVGPVLAGMLIHPFERAEEVYRFYRDFTRSTPEELIVFCGFLTTPDGVPVVALVPAYFGPIAEAEEALQPLRDFGPPIADQVKPMKYTELQRMMDDAFPPGLQVYWRGDFMTSLSDDAIEAVIGRLQTVSSPLSMVLFEQLGGAVSRVGHDDTAFDHRDALFNTAMISRWINPAEAEAHIAWARDLHEAIRPHTRGVYVNYLGVGEGEERVRAAYGSTKYDRLVALKTQYDPTNMFRYNQNIPPKR